MQKVIDPGQVSHIAGIFKYNMDTYLLQSRATRS